MEATGEHAISSVLAISSEQLEAPLASCHTGLAGATDTGEDHQATGEHAISKDGRGLEVRAWSSTVSVSVHEQVRVRVRARARRIGPGDIQGHEREREREGEGEGEGEGERERARERARESECTCPYIGSWVNTAFTSR
jgi:hypothetical protein